MNSFAEKLARLKQEAGQVEDQQVARLLGISKAALSERKARESFPEDKLFALAAKRPDLALDVGYVLTGERQPRHARMRADALAKVAGERGDPDLTRSVSGLIASDAHRNRARSHLFKGLTDLAEHCDDTHLRLLIDVAAAFRRSTEAVAQSGRKVSSEAVPAAQAASAPPATPDRG